MTARQGQRNVKDWANAQRHREPSVAIAEVRRTSIGGPLAPWNVPVANIPLRSDSATVAAYFWANCSNSAGNFNVRVHDFTYTVYYAVEATEERTVRSTGVASNWNGKKVPFKTGWVQAPGSDAQMIILDEVNGYEWNFFEVTGISATHIDCTRCNLVTGDYRTREVGFPPSRGIGIQYAAMLVRPEEVASGAILHAMTMPVKNTHCTVMRAPATKIESSVACVADGMPIGTRFSLNVTDQEIETWVAALPADVGLPMRNFARMLGKACRDYGWFITDTSGQGALQMESRSSAAAKWDALGIPAPFESQVNFKTYPNDILDGLFTEARMRVHVPSNEYPMALRSTQPIDW